MDVLREFTGNDELAVQAKNADQLRELIKLLAITSSQIGSRSLALVDNSGRPSSPVQAQGFAKMNPQDASAAQVSEETIAHAKQQVLVEEIRMGTRDILGEAVDIDAVDYDEGW